MSNYKLLMPPMALGAMLLLTPAADGQAAAGSTGEGLTEARGTTTAIVPVRPLRTFRGQAVLVPGNRTQRSIGVVRPLRVTPAETRPNPLSYYNRADRSDRWLSREVALGRIVLDAYPDPTSPREQSIGVVRAYRSPQGVTRNGVYTVTNPDAQKRQNEQTQTVGPRFAESAATGDPTVYALRSVDDLPAAQQNDGWALLNQGFYRNAAEVFGSDESTGRALAAALSGDFAAADDLMPSSPRLPRGVTLNVATQQRLEQLAAYLYSDDQAMQTAIRSLLGAESSPSMK